MKIAVVGAPNSGKTSLALALASSLSARGKPTLCVPDALPEWRLRHGRTPLRHEEAELAEEQIRRVEQAPPTDLLVVDSTALMTAIHGDLLWGDASLHARALEHQRGFALTLLTGLDFSGPAGGMRDPERLAREAVDARLRQLLDEQAMTYAVVYGSGSQRAARAMQALARHSGLTDLRPDLRQRPWQGYCEKCSDPECEHRLFTRQLGLGQR